MLGNPVQPFEPKPYQDGRTGFAPGKAGAKSCGGCHLLVKPISEGSMETVQASRDNPCRQKFELG